MYLRIEDPIPFLNPPRNLPISPEKELLLALLEDAWHLLKVKTDHAIPRGQAKIARRDTIAWIQGKTRGCRLTFAMCCEAFDFDEEKIRKKILTGIAEL